MERALIRALFGQEPEKLDLETAQARKQIKEKLQDTESFLDSIIERLPNMVFVKDAESLRFVRFNKAGEELLGHDRSELLGKSDYDFFSKEMAAAFIAKDREVLASGVVVDIPEEVIDTRFRGQRILHTRKIPISDAHGKPLFLLGISEDITDKKRAEAARHKAEVKRQKIMQVADRLNTIGILAAGMAHEINNPLQGMLSHLHRIKRSVADDAAAQNSAAMVERGIEIIADLVQKLMVLGGGAEEAGTGTADSNEVLRFVVQMTENQFQMANIRVESEEPKRTLQIAIAQRELIQVMLNLMINARDAMPEGGTLRITCREHNEHAVLEIADTGIGMEPDQLKQIFTPFYTTKGSKGTGLGLVVAASLIHQAGGTIAVESEPGTGTQFTLNIPTAKPMI